MTGKLRIGIIGVGLVGSCLLKQISSSPQLKDRLVIVAMATSKRMVLSSSDSTLAGREEDLVAKSTTATDISVLLDHVKLCAKNEGGLPVIVDCTAAETFGRLYSGWMRSGISVVTPNKKAFSSDLELFDEIRSLRSSAFCFHETTVGAGLPILSTLEDMIETGDEIVRIEGIFSGTLSFLFNSFSPASGSSAPPKFSDIVKEAKSRGYTEPDPRDDLNGLDMARKVVILGRLSGLRMSLDTLPVENIVPEPLRAVPSAEDFLARLGEFDDHFAKMNEEAAKNGQVLRYVGVIDPKGKSAVELKRYPTSHPFANLKGSDNVISFTTKRYPNSLVIQGAGAGAEVTASGVFADLLKILRASSSK